MKLLASSRRRNHFMLFAGGVVGASLLGIILSLGRGVNDTQVVTVVAKNLAFSPTEIRLDASQDAATVRLINGDQGQVLHNIAIHKDGAAGSIWSSGTVSGGGQTASQLPVPRKGIYTFRCDFHVNEMTGTLTVQ